MEGLEFYMFEDELWCKTSDGKNFMVDETHTELVKYILEKVRLLSGSIQGVGEDLLQERT